MHAAPLCRSSIVLPHWSNGSSWWFRRGPRSHFEETRLVTYVVLTYVWLQPSFSFFHSENSKFCSENSFTTITLLCFIIPSLSVNTKPKNMSQNQNGKWVQISPEQQLWGSSNGHVQVGGSNRLCINPQKDHKSKSYEDLQLEFNPLVFSSLEQYLPHHMLSLSREVKVHYMWSILLHYLPETERIRVCVTLILEFCGFFFVDLICVWKIIIVDWNERAQMGVGVWKSWIFLFF